MDIKYFGYVYPPEDEDDEDEARLKICEVCFMETPLKTALKKGLRAWADDVLETSKTYLEDTDEDEVSATSGTHLPMGSVTADTPSGTYWSYFDE